MRRAGLALTACLWAGAAAAQAPPGIAAAEYAEPTGRYDHAILGDATEWGALRLTLDCRFCQAPARIIRLPQTRVFEDIAPRLADMDGDGRAEVIAVETDLRRGARLSIYNAAGLVAATPFIGRPHRWLAPLGAADLDGDGRVEIAYIDRPHLAKTLRVWRFADGTLTEIAARPGLTNHRIGDAFVQGGIALCGDVPTIVTADADWARAVATTFRNGRLSARDLGPYTGRSSLDPDRAC